jgi:uncharacterized protein
MLDLTLLADEYAVCRMPSGSAVPSGLLELVTRGCVVSVTWTQVEVSVICPAEYAPDVAAVEKPWRCIRVVGPLNLAATGWLASILTPLADARVNIFAFSTYDTDYLLVPSVRLAEAISALTTAGHRITG